LKVYRGSNRQATLWGYLEKAAGYALEKGAEKPTIKLGIFQVPWNKNNSCEFICGLFHCHFGISNVAIWQD
jgi:hypothetical protein